MAINWGPLPPVVPTPPAPSGVIALSGDVTGQSNNNLVNTINGAAIKSINSFNSPYNLLQTDLLIHASGAAGNVTINLRPATHNQIIIINRTDFFPSTITLVPSFGNSIVNETQVPANGYVILIPDGISTWYTLTGSNNGTADPVGPAGGDLAGTYPNPIVAQINSNPLGVTTPVASNILVADGTKWNSVAPSGDVTVTPSGSIFVAGIQGHAITNSPAASGQVLIYESATNTLQWVAQSSSGGGSPTGPAGGDLSGTYPNPIVAGFNGIPLASGEPHIQGEVPTYQSISNNIKWSLPLGSGIIIASELSGIYGDSSIANGGGHDDTAVLQTALDQLYMISGGILILDKAFLVTGLHIASNTTIAGLGWSTGLYRAANANVPIIRNANPTTATPQDTNIELINFAMNGNGPAQSGTPAPSEQDTFVHGMAFYGVSHLTLQALYYQDYGQPAPTYGFMLTNTDNVLIKDTQMQQGNGGANDGIHFLGPNSHIRIYNCWGQSGSDFVALNGSDYHGYSSSWITNDGDITNVLIDGIYLQNSLNGIGIISDRNNTHDITVKNLSGTVLEYAVSIWNAWPELPTGTADNLHFENINITAFTDSGAIPSKSIVWIGGTSQGGYIIKVGLIDLVNCRWNNDSTNRPWTYVDYNAFIDTMTIDNLIVYEPTANTNGRSVIRNMGSINNLNMNEIEWYRPAGSVPSGYLLDGTGSIGNLSMVAAETTDLAGLIDYNSLTVSNSSTDFGGDLNVPSQIVITSPSGNIQIIGTLPTEWTRVDSLDQTNIYNTVLSPTEGIAASGGTITSSDGYNTHIFTSGGTFIVPSGGPVQLEVLMVAGGGGGAAGGGGGGGVLYVPNMVIASGSYTITIGDGGTPGTTTNPGTNGTNGGDSTFNGYTAVGGGAGGALGQDGSDGGSGGGGAGGSVAQMGGTGTSGQGNAGGNSNAYGIDYASAGGGGAGSAGHSNGSGTTAANGGDGIANSILGTSLFYGGGGGGATFLGGTPGNGGLGGGGNGGSTTGSAGSPNTGGGGGGSNWLQTPGNGGSGIIIIRYYVAGSLNKVSIIESKDSAITGEAGIQTYGDPTGRSIVDGSTTRFNLVGTEVGSITNSGLIFTIPISGSNFTVVPTPGVIPIADASGTLNAWITGIVSSGASGIAGGDLSGTYPNPAVVQIQGYPVEVGSPTDADIFAYSTTNGRWEHAQVSGDLTATYNPVSHIEAYTVNSINGVAYNADPLVQYLLLAGRSGGQVAYGGTASGDNLKLSSTSNSTKGKVILSDDESIYVDDVNEKLNVGAPRSTSATLNVEPSTYNVVGSTLRAHATSGGSITPATGGTITHTGGYYYHDFTSNGTFTISAGGPTFIDRVLIGGGAAGKAGGGGAGDLLEDFNIPIANGAFSVTIAASVSGGTNSNPSSNGTSGNSSTFNGDTASGGGGGAGTNNGNGSNGASGGGGGSSSPGSSSGGTATGTNGHNGGNYHAGSDYASGGGGGASTAGQTAPSGSTSGNGGDGLESVIATALNGTSTKFCGGGGGMGYSSGDTPGAGGTGGGGAGAGTTGVSGTANTGGGGGGTSNGGTSGGGASGRLIIRYSDTTSSAQTADLHQNLADDATKLSGWDCEGNTFNPVDASVTATGSSSTDAYTLIKNLTEFTTVDSGTGAILNSAFNDGTPIYIVNSGANSLSIYPPSGGQIDALGTNNPYTLTAGSKVTIRLVSSTQAYSF